MSEGSVMSQDKRQDESEAHDLPSVAQHKIGTLLYLMVPVLIHLALFWSPFTQLNVASHEVRPSLTEYVMRMIFSCSVCYKMSVVIVSAWPAILCSFTHGLGGDVKYTIQATFLVLTQEFQNHDSLFPSVKKLKDENRCLHLLN